MVRIPENYYFVMFNIYLWARGGAVGWDTATNRKVAGSIPDGVTGIFHWHNPSGRTMVDSASNGNTYQK
jgi:hypothetical protein